MYNDCIFSILFLSIAPIYLQAIPNTGGRIVNNGQPVTTLRQPQYITQNGQTYQISPAGQPMQSVQTINQVTITLLIR